MFDLSRISKDQVRAFLNRKAQDKLTGGIYLWVNQNNGHFYVSSTLNFYNRMAGYFSLCGATGIILNALVKYGNNSFTLVLFIIPNANKEGVLKLEQFVLDTWKPEYNIQLNAIYSAGRILSVEHKNKIAFAREGSIHTEETKAKIAASLTGDRSPRFNKGTPVYLYEVHSTKLELSATFPNRFRAAAFLDVPF
uniref:GIY-YIG protein n=4 Tax=Rhizophagus TaxID=1129544 RepID=A0A140F2C4_9GLOM|nr:GIY-YIG orf [Rhizophagus intraradices]ACM45007.1 GIY-YIG orf [Rhizophagus intraradices]AML60478.1 GIY-YIG protein [Rhizophagus irregularis]AML60509.1 GIY-YIG protein [Rhizophagus irregularis]AML60558.1 GIY-YIG protein [Rhizophagus irregularis]